TDHHRIEPAVWALQCLQKASSIRATARRYRPGLVNVEELGDDPSVPANQSLSTAPLPSTRGLGVLEIVRGHTCPQGESELVSFLGYLGLLLRLLGSGASRSNRKHALVRTLCEYSKAAPEPLSASAQAVPPEARHAPCRARWTSRAPVRALQGIGPGQMCNHPPAKKT